jgi:hypothetical protein
VRRRQTTTGRLWATFVLPAIVLGGVTLAARTARAQTAVPTSDQMAPGEARLHDSQLGIRDLGLAQRDTAWDGRLWAAYRGEGHQRIDSESFLRLVGRPDLARSNHRRTIARTTLLFSGWALLAAGTVVTTSAWTALCCGNETSSRPLLGANVGIALAAQGLVGVLEGSSIEPQPIDAAEAAALAARYNAAVRPVMR